MSSERKVSKAAARRRSQGGSGPRIVRKDTVERLRRSGASKDLIRIAEKAIKTNPA